MVWPPAVWYSPELDIYKVAVPIAYDDVDALGMYFYASVKNNGRRYRWYWICDL